MNDQAFHDNRYKHLSTLFTGLDAINKLFTALDALGVALVDASEEIGSIEGPNAGADFGNAAHNEMMAELNKRTGAYLAKINAARVR